jgi:hypothetical protein
LQSREQSVAADSKKLNNAELEEIVLYAGHVVAALRIHGKTVATLGDSGVRLKAGDETR